MPNAIGEERTSPWLEAIAGIRSNRIPDWAPSPCRLPGPVTRYETCLRRVFTAATVSSTPFRAPVSVCGAGCACAGQAESGRLDVNTLGLWVFNVSSSSRTCACTCTCTRAHAHAHAHVHMHMHMQANTGIKKLFFLFSSKLAGGSRDLAAWRGVRPVLVHGPRAAAGRAPGGKMSVQLADSVAEEYLSISLSLYLSRSSKGEASSADNGAEHNPAPSPSGPPVTRS
jgi:hypothetical protein